MTETLLESNALYLGLLKSRRQENGIRKAAFGVVSACERMLYQWGAWDNHCASTGANPGAPKPDQFNDFLVDAQMGTTMDRGKKRQRTAIGLLRDIGWVRAKHNAKSS